MTYEECRGVVMKCLDVRIKVGENMIEIQWHLAYRERNSHNEKHLNTFRLVLVSAGMLIGSNTLPTQSKFAVLLKFHNFLGY